jgi:hypothetical protein
MEIEPPLVMFRPLEIHVLASILGFAKGQPFEFGESNSIGVRIF